MSVALGTSLVAGITFTVDDVPTTPSTPPVVIAAYFGDGTLLSPLPAVGSPISPGHYEIEIFTDDQVTVMGTYTATIRTEDATMDRQSFAPWWSNVGENDTATFSGNALQFLEDIQEEIGQIRSGILWTQIPVAETGATTLVRGSAYTEELDKLLVYTISGEPNFTVGAPAYWRGTTLRRIDGLNVLVIEGVCTDVDEMTFELTVIDVAKLKNGNFSLRTAIDSDDITTPDNSLTILESIGS